MHKRLYYDTARPSGFATLSKLVAASGKNPTPVKQWLLTQDKYTLHRPLRKKFPRNPYTVTNSMDVWESDLGYVQGLNKFNDKYRFLLTVIDVFTKYLHVVPLLSKTGVAVAAAFVSILKDSRYSGNKRPVWLRTDKGKEFLNRTFQELLKHEGIQFQICRKPDVKCSVIVQAHRTLRDKLYMHFTYRNTYPYIDVLASFVKAYNDTVHTSTCMAPSQVRDTDIRTIWRRLNRKVPVLLGNGRS